MIYQSTLYGFYVQVENLRHRDDLSDEEKGRRRKKLEEEVAAGVVGVGILGFAGYEGYEHYSKKNEGQGGYSQEPEKKHHGFF